jgi:hypothetical protein
MSFTSGICTGSLCLLCGHTHTIRSVCPCPQCLTYHDGSSCLGDVRCVICGIYHLSVECHGSIARICKVCGALHSSFQGCPCARCGYWHKGSLCIDACALCNNFHEGNCPGRWSCYCKLCGRSNSGVFITWTVPSDTTLHHKRKINTAPTTKHNYRLINTTVLAIATLKLYTQKQSGEVASMHAGNDRTNLQQHTLGLNSNFKPLGTEISALL